MDEFYSMGIQSQPLSPFASRNNSSSVDSDKKLNLRFLQSQMDSKRVEREKKADFSDKLKDLKFNYCTGKAKLTSNAVPDSKSFFNNYSINLDKDESSIKRSSFSPSVEVTSTIKNNDSINTRLKFKMMDFMRKANELGENGSSNKKKSTDIIAEYNVKNKYDVKDKFTKNSLMNEFKLFNENKNKKSQDNQNKLGGVSFYSPARDMSVRNETVVTNYSPSKKKEKAKNNILSMLNSLNSSGHNHDSNNKISFTRLKHINHEDNGMAMTRTTYTTNSFINSSIKIKCYNLMKLFNFLYLFLDKYPNEIVSKLKKKFPELVKSEHSTAGSKNYIENDKINMMKSKIQKMFE